MTKRRYRILLKSIRSLVKGVLGNERIAFTLPVGKECAHA